jgi:hypothetical protein
MPSDRRNLPEQELSIKEREQELFVEPGEPPPPKPQVKPFARYLQETPAEPLSTPAKAILWTVGVIVLILLALAIWRSQRSPRPRPKPRAAEPEATALAAPRHEPCPDWDGTRSAFAPERSLPFGGPSNAPRFRWSAIADPTRRVESREETRQQESSGALQTEVTGSAPRFGLLQPGPRTTWET